jgi:glycosyltransferase 2 family protein
MSMDDDKKKQRRVKYSIIFSISLSIAIILIILYFTITPDSIKTLLRAKIRYEFFVIAIILNFISWVFWGARLKVLSNAMEKQMHIGLWESIKIVMANLFLAGITPSQAGGEPVRIYLLHRDGMTFGGATATVLGERLIDAIFILVTIPFAFFIFKDVTDIGFLSTGLLAGIIVFVVVVTLFIYAVLKPEKTKAFLIFINEKIKRIRRKKEGETKFIGWMAQEVDNFHLSMMSFKGNRLALVYASILSVLMWSTGFMIPSMILKGLGFPPDYIDSYAAQMLLLIVVMLPITPGSSGITEGGMAGLYGFIIHDKVYLGIFVLLFRFITYHMNLIVGAISQYRIFKSLTSFSLEKIETKK